MSDDFGLRAAKCYHDVPLNAATNIDAQADVLSTIYQGKWVCLEVAQKNRKNSRSGVLYVHSDSQFFSKMPPSRQSWGCSNQDPAEHPADSTTAIHQVFCFATTWIWRNNWMSTWRSRCKGFLLN